MRECRILTGAVCTRLSLFVTESRRLHPSLRPPVALQLVCFCGYATGVQQGVDPLWVCGRVGAADAGDPVLPSSVLYIRRTHLS